MKPRPRHDNEIRKIASALINAASPRLKIAIRGGQIDEAELEAEIEARLRANGVFDD